MAGCWRRLRDYGQNHGAAEGVVGAGFVIIMVSCGVWGRGVVEAQISRLWSGAGATSC